METIKFSEFEKIDLKVADVISAVSIPGSDKLIKLTVSVGGEEPRQIVAGIGQFYQTEEMVGKKVVVVLNLEPRKLMGEESHGMLLAAHGSEGDPVLVVPEKSVPAGSTIS